MTPPNQPQDAHSVAYRALCLGALLKRAEYEMTVQNLGHYILTTDLQQHIRRHHVASNAQLHQWLHDERIAPHLTQSERQLLHAPLATWTEQTIVHVSWRVEALGVMLWSLDILGNIPPYDTQFEPDEVLYPLDVMTPTIDFIWRARLRPAETIRTMRDCAELWNWRSRAWELQMMGVRPPVGFSFREIIRMTAEKAHEKGIPPLIDGDFPAFGRPYAAQSDDQFSISSAIAYERYFALNWVCEIASAWAGLPVE